MKNLINIVLYLIPILCWSTPPPTVFTTIGSPSWTTGTNWDGGSSPSVNGGSNTTYNINNTMSVTTAGFTLGSNSVLNICNTCTLTINGDLTLSNGSTLNVPSGAVLIVNGNVINNNNSDQVFIDGVIQINGNFSGGTGSSVTSPSGTGSMDISGSVNTSGNGTVFNSDTDCTANCDNSPSDPLPVKFLYFYGDVSYSDIILSWATASEINNDMFLIQNSIDGVNWNIRGSVKGNGSKSHQTNYNWVDEDVIENIYYYRLKQIDFNGNFEYSSIILIDIDMLPSKKNIEVVPNPVRRLGELNLIINGFIGEEILIVVTDIFGKIYYEKVFLIDNLKEIVVISNTLLCSGTYLIIGTSKQELYMKKIIIN